MGGTKNVKHLIFENIDYFPEFVNDFLRHFGTPIAILIPFSMSFPLGIAAFCRYYY